MGGWKRRSVLAVVVAAVAAQTIGFAPATPSAHAATPTGPTSRFEAVGPVRLTDTRQASCGCSRVDDRTIRVVVGGTNGIRADITAVAVTITAAGPSADGYVTVFPAGSAMPQTSTLNVRRASVGSNSTVVPVGAGGAIDLFAQVPMDLIVDVTGVFVAAPAATTGRYIPTPAERLLDTRDSSPDGLAPGTAVTVPLPVSVGPDALAVAVNVTTLGEGRPGFVTGFPAGAARPSTSFMNPDGTGRVKASAVILPVSAAGFTVDTTAGGHVVIDIVGWFTGASAGESTVGLFVPLNPERLLDTRLDRPRIWLGGTREIASPSADAAAVVTNVTIDQADGLGFVTAYPAGTTRPPTSSLNAQGRDATVSNLAITALSERGLAYFANAGTDLVVDITGVFLGPQAAAPLPPAPNVMATHRVLLVGDSTLGALEYATGTRRAFIGFEAIVDAKNCRRLLTQGCRSDYSNIVPTTVVEAIQAVPGALDIVVVKAGYNDPLSPFVPALDAIIAAARAKGARTILYLTFSDSTSDFVQLLFNNNATLQRLAGTPAYPDLVVADWRTFATPSSGWYVADRHHLTTLGAWGTADYIARWVAHLDRRPCPTPWTVGGPLTDPCPNPDAFASGTGTLPAIRQLYGI